MIKFDAIFSPATVSFVHDCQSRKAALQIAAKLVGDRKKSVDPKILLEKLLVREGLGSTVLEDTHVSIPHCRFNGCSAPIGAILRFIPHVMFGTDGAVNMCFVLVVPAVENETHLKILSSLAKLCLSNTRLNYLMDATTPKNLYDRFIQTARKVSSG